MNHLEPSRASFSAQVVIDIESRTTNEDRVRLEVRDRASPHLEVTHVSQELYRKAIEEGHSFFVCLQPLWWTGYETIRANVAFAKCTFQADNIKCTRPTSNPYVEDEVLVPVFFEDDKVYCNLTALQEELQEHYVS